MTKKLEKAGYPAVLSGLMSKPINLSDNILSKFDQDALPYLILFRYHLRDLVVHEPVDIDVGKGYFVHLYRTEPGTYSGYLAEKHNDPLLLFKDQTLPIIASLVAAKIEPEMIEEEALEPEKDFNDPDLESEIEESTEIATIVEAEEKPKGHKVSICPDGHINIEVLKSLQEKGVMKNTVELIKAMNQANDQQQEQIDPNMQNEEAPIEQEEPVVDEEGHEYIRATKHEGGSQFWYKDPATGKYHEKENAPEGHEDFDHAPMMKEMMEQISTLADEITKLKQANVEKEEEPEKGEENIEQKESLKEGGVEQEEGMNIEEGGEELNEQENEELDEKKKDMKKSMLEEVKLILKSLKEKYPEASNETLIKAYKMYKTCGGVHKAEICEEGFKEPEPTLIKKQGVPEGVDPAVHERCVIEVKKQGKDKESAIRICNVALQKSSKFSNEQMEEISKALFPQPMEIKEYTPSKGERERSLFHQIKYRLDDLKKLQEYRYVIESECPEIKDVFEKRYSSLKKEIKDLGEEFKEIRKSKENSEVTKEGHLITSHDKESQLTVKDLKREDVIEEKPIKKSSRLQRMWKVFNIEMPEEIKTRENIKNAHNGARILKSKIVNQGKEDSEAENIVRNTLKEKYGEVFKSIIFFKENVQDEKTKKYIEQVEKSETLDAFTVNEEIEIRDPYHMHQLRKMDSDNRFNQPAWKDTQIDIGDHQMTKNTDLNERIKKSMESEGLDWSDKEYKTFNEEEVKKAYNKETDTDKLVKARQETNWAPADQIRLKKVVEEDMDRQRGINKEIDWSDFNLSNFNEEIVVKSYQRELTPFEKMRAEQDERVWGVEKAYTVEQAVKDALGPLDVDEVIAKLPADKKDDFLKKLRETKKIEKGEDNTVAGYSGDESSTNDDPEAKITDAEGDYSFIGNELVSKGGAGSGRKKTHFGFSEVEKKEQKERIGKLETKIKKQKQAGEDSSSDEKLLATWKEMHLQKSLKDKYPNISNEKINELIKKAYKKKTKELVEDEREKDTDNIIEEGHGNPEDMSSYSEFKGESEGGDKQNPKTSTMLQK